MIYRDSITVGLKVRTGTSPAGQAIYTTTNHKVAGAVTWLDSTAMVDVAGNRLRSRLRIILSPFDKVIPPDVGANLTVTWGPFANLIPDGAVEPHYLHGRLHHYEVIVKMTTT